MRITRKINKQSPTGDELHGENCKRNELLPPTSTFGPLRLLVGIALAREILGGCTKCCHSNEMRNESVNQKINTLSIYDKSSGVARGKSPSINFHGDAKYSSVSSPKWVYWKKFRVLASKFITIEAQKQSKPAENGGCRNANFTATQLCSQF